MHYLHVSRVVGANAINERAHTKQQTVHMRTEKHFKDQLGQDVTARATKRNNAYTARLCATLCGDWPRGAFFICSETSQPVQG